MSIASSEIRRKAKNLVIGCLVTLTIVTIGYAGMEAYVQSITAALTGIFGILVLWRISQGRLPINQPKRLVLPSALFLVVLSWGYFQSVADLPASWIREAYQDAEMVLNTKTSAHIALDPSAAQYELVWYVLYAFHFLAGWIIGNSRSASALFLRWFIALQVAFAILSVAIFLAPETTVFELFNTAYEDSLTSTFVNRNSYAGFLGMGIFCALGLFFEKLKTSINDTGGRLALRNVLKPELFWPFGAIMILTLVLVGTNSRGGFASVGVGILLIIATGLTKTMKRGNWSISAIALSAVLLIGLASQFISDRIQPNRLNDATEDRAEIMMLTIRMMSDAPLRGIGLGGFKEASSTYLNIEDLTFRGLVNAHNTYLEVITELGAIGAMPLFLLLGFVCLKSAFGRGIWAWIAAATSVQMALHSIVDFTLEIPANVCAFVMIIGIAYSKAAKKSP